MKFIFLGPPGAGKGTHADIVSEKLGIPKITMGDLLRDQIKLNTELGRKIKDTINAGIYVNDEITLDILKSRLSKGYTKRGFILDGFPRTLNQAEKLEHITKIDLVLNFNLSKESVLERLIGRWTCKKCQDNYHVKYRKPKKPKTCDRCGGELYQREDQKVIEKRLEVYESETKPLIEFYQKRKILDNVYCEGEIEEVSKRVFDAIEKYK